MAAVRHRFAKQRKDVFALSNFYLIYERGENTKYVSHLDFVRVFGRAMRRAQIPIAYSEGFNPHPLLTFALPLPVGHTSECELLEITLAEDIPKEEIVSKLNGVLPAGITVKEAFEGKSRLKKLDNAKYIVRPENLPESVEGFWGMKEIVIEKKTKSGIKETDIRSDIKEIKITPDSMEMVLSAGSRANLKPEIVIKAMNKYIEGYDSGDCAFHRVDIYDNEMKTIRGE